MSTTPALEPSHRFDFFEPGDKTALICLDIPEVQRTVVEQVDSLGYKIHTGMFLDDCVLKLYSHPYDLVITSDEFSGQDLHNHAILHEAAHAVAESRRKQIYVLLGSMLATNDELQAFSLSVEVVVNLADVAALRSLVRRAGVRRTELYSTLIEVQARLSGDSTPVQG